MPVDSDGAWGMRPPAVGVADPERTVFSGAHHQKKLSRSQAALFSTEQLEGRPHSAWLLRS